MLPSREAQKHELRLAERKAELERLADKGAVKRRIKEGRFRPVLLDMLPPTPIRDDFWSPLPVEPSDESFIRPEVSDTKITLRDYFSRPLTKIVDTKKYKIEVIPETEKTDINETNLFEQLSAEIQNLTDILLKIDKNSFEFFTEKKMKNLTKQADYWDFCLII